MAQSCPGATAVGKSYLGVPQENEEVKIMEYFTVKVEAEIWEYFRKEATKTIGPTPESKINDVLREYISKRKP